MLMTARRLLAAPAFEGDEDRTLKAWLLNLFILAETAGLAIMVIGVMLGGRTPQSVLGILIVSLALIPSLRYPLFRGRVDLAAYGLIVLSFVVITLVVTVLGTIRAPAAAGYLVLIVTAGLLLDHRTVALITAATALAVIGLILAEDAGLLPHPDLTVTLTQWVTFAVLLVWVALVTQLALHGSWKTLSRARQQLAERRRAEEALRDSEEKFRSIVEQSNDGIVLIDEQGTVIEWNRGEEQITGVQRADAIGRPIWDVQFAFLPEDRRSPATYQQIKTMYLESLGTGQLPWLNQLIENTIQRPDGTRRIIQTRTFSIGTNKGYMYGSISRDITEHKQAEEALRESQARYRQLFELESDAILLIDNETGRILEANSAASELYGYSREELLTKKNTDLSAEPDDTQRVTQSTPPISDRVLTVPLRFHRTKDGVVFPVEITGRFFIMQGRSLHIAAIRDITERKRVEDTLRESERRFREMLENVDLIAVMLDPQGRVTFCNDFLLKLTGWQRDECVCQDWFSMFLPLDAQESVRSMFFEAITSGDIPRHHENEIVTRQRERRLIAWNNTMLRDHQGNVIGTTSIGEDVTGRRNAEEALRQAQKMESLGILAGGVAHDFNNLLVAMIGQTSLAQAKLSPESPAYAHIQKAVKAAERASDLTRQMLAYSGRGQFEKRPIHLNTLIHENLHLFEVAVPKNVQLRSDLAEPLPLIDGDVGQMQQVLMNLIINAAEAIGERPGTVSVSTSTCVIDAEDDRLWRYTGEPLQPGPYVILGVRDNGSGMDGETLSKIFDPFFTTKFTGRGLGLAAALGIVRGHQGGLHVESAPGRGTSFQLYFPASDAAEGKPAGPSDDASTAVSRVVTLVIDDEAPVREAVTDILEMEGLTVIAAATGAEGIELYRKRARGIGLVLLDLSMPGLSGEETFKQLRQIDPEVRVILSSGYSQAEAFERFAGEGLLGFIQKPYDADTLIREVRRHLG